MVSLGVPDGVLRRARELDADAASLLTGRAALLGLSPRGRISAGGATHLVRAADGWWALTLSRDDDIAAVPALVEADDAFTDPWPAVHRWAAQRSTTEVCDRAVLLDLPAAILGEAEAAMPRVLGCGTAGPARPADGLLVADLTSMWAGPLCGQLLSRAGAVVVKVESPSRPDGTRAGDRAFFDWMNGGKLCYAADLDDAEKIRRLLAVADVVLEGSRPGALARRGLGPHDCPPRQGRIWLQITGHGTEGRNANRVAFGDDAAAAGGLVGYDADGPVFVGDAIADPLTGLESARAVSQALARGGGLLVEISMAAVAAGYAESPGRVALLDASLPKISSAAGNLGSDNALVEQIIAERLGESC